MRPAYLECSACAKRHEVGLRNLCDCGAPLFARYEGPEVARDRLRPRSDLWRYAPLLPLEDREIVSRGEGGTPILHAPRLAQDLGFRDLLVKDEGRNPTGTFKARGMAVAVPMAKTLGAKALVVPTAGNAGAALGLYAATYGLPATVFVAPGAPPSATCEAEAFGATVVPVPGNIADAGREAQARAQATGAFNVATLREPYRVEGKKTMLLEIWEAPTQMPDWILFPTGGGTGVVGIWKALGELRDLGWYEGPWPRIGLVQSDGCAPLVKAFREGRDRAEPWPDPRTAAAGLRVPSTVADRIVLRALRETKGAAVAVPDAEMAQAARDLARRDGISACLEGAATLAGLRRLLDAGTIRTEESVLLVNTGTGGGGAESVPSSPTARSDAGTNGPDLAGRPPSSRKSGPRAMHP